MRSANPSGGPIQTGTLISYSFRGDARLGSTLRAASAKRDPESPDTPQPTPHVPDQLRLGMQDFGSNVGDDLDELVNPVSMGPMAEDAHPNREPIVEIGTR
jgi:hypothetical protein